MNITSTSRHCRVTTDHPAHQWYGNLNAGEEPDYHQCSGIQIMTNDELRSWFTERGVDPSDPWLTDLIRRYTGSTQDDMDNLYRDMHND